MSIGAIPVLRGCDERIKGGVYFECGTSPWGRPIEDFLIDPIVPINPKEMGISAQGVRLIERNGVYHVADWVGRTGYPNPTDDIEECRRFGMSARGELPDAEDYARLNGSSRVLRIHSRAWLDEGARQSIWTSRVGMGSSYEWQLCPRNIKLHNDLEYNVNIGLIMCVGLLWEDVLPVARHEEESRMATRTMPSFTYECAEGFGFAREAYRPGIYASFPITRIVVVKDPETGKHEKKLKKLGKVDFCPVDLVDE